MKRILFTLLFIGVVFVGKAQDYHFSQFYFSHFTVNPAYSGRFAQDFRFFGIHRSQWYNINSKTNTTGFAYDMNFENEMLGDNILGVGIFGVNDDFEGGYFQEQEVGLSLAIHRPLDGLNRNIVSLGIQTNIGQKSILGPEELLWSSEYDLFERPVDGNTNAGENYSGGTTSNFRFNIGAAWSYQVTEYLGINLGASVFNMNKPKETLYDVNSSTGERENWRNTINFSANYKFNERLGLNPSMLLSTHSGAANLVYGSFFSYAPPALKDNNVVVYLGPWFRGGYGDRSRDALIGATALEYRHYRLGASYDFTVSNLTDIKIQDEFSNAGRIGTFEISFTYVGFFNRSVPNDYTIPCKFF